MAHMKVKRSNSRRRIKKWRKILAIVEGKMSLSQDAKSTSMMERIKWEEKSIVRCSRKDNSKMLGDRFIVRERMEYKGHHHVQKPRAFCKCRTVSELALTPLGRTFTKGWFELILGHSPQMLTTRIVRKLYPRNSNHIRNKLQCDKNARTSNVSKEKRYWTINPMHVGVKHLDKHERTSDQDVTQWLPSPTVNDSGKVSVSKVLQNDLVFGMNAMSRKVLRECLVGIIITEPKMRRSRIRRWRCLGTKRVPRQSRLTFWCHRHY